jgi:PTS system fructose-specific IIA component
MNPPHLHPSCFIQPLNAISRDEAITTLITAAAQTGFVSNVTAASSMIIKREAIRHTCSIDGFCFPRAASEGVSQSFLAIGRLATPVRWHADHLVTTIILFGAPLPKDTRFLKTIMEVGRFLQDKQKRDLLKSARDSADLYDISVQVFDW